MSFTDSNQNFIDDELFLADCSSSKYDKNSSGTLYSSSLAYPSVKNSPNGNILAYFMLRSLLLRIFYNRGKYIYTLKFKKFMT